MDRLNELATQAFHHKKANKKELFKQLETLINSLSDDDYKKNKDSLSNFYGHFTPPVPAKIKTPIDFLKKIKTKNDIRFYLNFIYADIENIVATDGHIVAVTKNDKNMAGFYDQNLIKCDIEATYPAYKRVIDKSQKWFNQYKINFNSIDDIKVIIHNNIEVIKLFDNEKYTYDSKYIKLIKNYFGDNEIDVEITDFGVLHINSNDILIVLMPITIK